jgi:hypothetical protein
MHALALQANSFAVQVSFVDNKDFVLFLLHKPHTSEHFT